MSKSTHNLITFKNFEEYTKYISNNKEIYPSRFDYNLVFKIKDFEKIKEDLISESNCNCIKCIFKNSIKNDTQIFNPGYYSKYVAYMEIIFQLIESKGIDKFTNLISNNIQDLISHHKKNISPFVKEYGKTENELYQFKNNDYVYIKDIKSKPELNRKLGKILKDLNNHRYIIEFFDKTIKNVSISIYNLGLIKDYSKIKECSICFEKIDKIQICPYCSNVFCYKCYSNVKQSCDKCFFCSYEWKILFSNKMIEFIDKLIAFTDFVSKVFPQ